MATTSSRRKQQGEVNDKGKSNDDKIEMVLIESSNCFKLTFIIISYLFLFLNLGIVVVKNLKEMDKGKNGAGGGKCLRTCASIVFSTIGVGAILISYIFCGAILFLTLEGNNGKQCKEYAII